VEFHFRQVHGDRRHYVDEDDVNVVLSRLSPEVAARIREIHFVDHARGNRVLGYTTRARREVALCALPHHVSLNRFLSGPETPGMYGAVAGTQWPSLAVRRFMLYDVLLHEIGHLHVVDGRERSVRRKFADETIAQDLANRWREDLWSTHFDHADPVHNPPTAEETAALSRWGEAHAEYRRGMAAEGDTARQHHERAAELYPAHSHALTELSHCIVRQAMTELRQANPRDARQRAVELLARALHTDRTCPRANLWMGWNCGHLDRHEDARRHLASAMRQVKLNAKALASCGDAHADWGFLAEAERFFEKSLAVEPENASALRGHARAVWDLGADTPAETSRALALFERAIAAAPGEGLSFFWYAFALATIPGQAGKALQHAERALALRPEDRRGADLVTRLREPLCPGELAHLERETFTTRAFDRRTGEVIELDA
jgi:tetratricopeptide (TPR) repeat protein